MHVVVTAPLHEKTFRSLQAAVPEATFRSVDSLVRREFQLLKSGPGSGEQKRATADLDAAIGSAEVILCGFRLPNGVPARTPQLKWVQCMAAGVERLMDGGLFEAGVTLTNGKGIAATPIAEWVLGAMLMFSKKMPEHFYRKTRRLYQRTDVLPFSLEGKTVGVLGLGAIGSEVARLSKALGMKVIATKRTVGGSDTQYVDSIHSPARTDDLLRASDFVVVALPLIKETTRFISERELRLMKPTAFILNVGRGPIIDEGALVRALKERTIAGAALDVFEKEPLPQESDLWALENVVYSPHISGEVDDYDDRAAALFIKNLRRYLSGQPLLNIVDRARGY